MFRLISMAFAAFAVTACATQTDKPDIFATALQDAIRNEGITVVMSVCTAHDELGTDIYSAPESLALLNTLEDNLEQQAQHNRVTLRMLDGAWAYDSKASADSAKGEAQPHTRGNTHPTNAAERDILQQIQAPSWRAVATRKGKLYPKEPAPISLSPTYAQQGQEYFGGRFLLMVNAGVYSASTARKFTQATITAALSIIASGATAFVSTWPENSRWHRVALVDLSRRQVLWSKPVHVENTENLDGGPLGSWAVNTLAPLFPEKPL